MDVLDHEGLKRDVARRIALLHAMMRANGYAALLLLGDGSPDGLGALRYVANVRIWAGRAYAVLGEDDPDPWVQIASPYQALWTRNETTTRPERVESGDDPVARAAARVRDCTGHARRVGVVSLAKLTLAEHAGFSAALGGFELIDAGGAFDAIRRIKSAFEIAAMRENGAILDAAMDVFAQHAHVGARYRDACAAAEAFVKARGAFWGRSKLSLDRSPYTVPPPADRRMRADDVVNFELVYESPFGYWLEMTTVFSFGDPPDDVAALLQAYLRAFEASCAEARPGATFRTIADTNDATLRALGFAVAGKHTPDCHSIGLDGADGPNSLAAPEFTLAQDMVLSFHPGAILAGNRGFLISDNVLVTPRGGERLSPHTPARAHVRLAG
jgi:Xaa-Pro aminopeptidase